MDWYYVSEGKQAGPVPEEEFRRLVAQGTIGRETLVWRSGMAQWQPYAQAPADDTSPGSSAPPIAGGDSAACSHCGRVFPVSEMLAYSGQRVCASCKPVFMQRLREGVTPAAAMRYAGFWIRFVARLIDGIILYVVNVLLAMAFGLGIFGGGVPNVNDSGQMASLLGLQALVFVCQIAVAATYETFFVGRFAATPGKLALKLRVVRADGTQVTYGRACGRYFGTFLSSLTLLIGYIIAAFDSEKRALHDRICDTRVVRA